MVYERFSGSSVGIVGVKVAPILRPASISANPGNYKASTALPRFVLRYDHLAPLFRGSRALICLSAADHRCNLRAIGYEKAYAANLILHVPMIEYARSDARRCPLRIRNALSKQ
jgi:hypothetical protein